MVRISILGTGNVAQHLFDAFTATEIVKVVQVIGRNKTALAPFGKKAETVSDFSQIADADIFIVAVKDDAIPEVSECLKDKKGLVVHTSGSVSIDALSPCARYGVFYPLQTFSKDRNVVLKSVPFCLEAYDIGDLQLLKELAGQISEEVYEVDSEQRKALHLAAVFVNNFTNHLYHIGKEICDEKGLPFAILQPLIGETADKIKQLSPYEAQTGPARRGDSETIKRHLGELEDLGPVAIRGYKDIYKTLGASITSLYSSRRDAS